MAFLATTDLSTTTTTRMTLRDMVNKPFDWLVSLAERSPRAQALDALAQVTDRQLAERGMTRTGEVQRILGSQAYL